MPPASGSRAVECIGCRIEAGDGERRGQNTGGKQSAEDCDDIGNVHRAIVIRVGGVEAATWCSDCENLHPQHDKCCWCGSLKELQPAERSRTSGKVK